MAKLRVEICNMDALEYLATIQDETVQVICTDPPYWTLDKWRNIGTTTRLGGNRKEGDQRPEMFFETIDMKYLWECFLEFDRILSLDGHLYIFADDIVSAILMNWVQEAQGDHRFGGAHLLVWDKVNMGMGYHYRHRYEHILFAWREKREGVRGFKPRRLRDLGKADVFQYKRVTGKYPTEKPSALVGELVTQSLRIGETCCDPFCGSGVLASAVPFSYNAKILLNDKSPQSMEYMKDKWHQDLLSSGAFDVIWDSPRIVEHT